MLNARHRHSRLLASIGQLLYLLTVFSSQHMSTTFYLKCHPVLSPSYHCQMTTEVRASSGLDLYEFDRTRSDSPVLPGFVGVPKRQVSRLPPGGADNSLGFPGLYSFSPSPYIRHPDSSSKARPKLRKCNLKRPASTAATFGFQPGCLRYVG